MALYSKEKIQEHISQIRRILVMNPDITILRIQEKLAKSKKPINLDKDYINKLTNRIRKERAKRYNGYTINKVLVRFQDEVEELKKNLWNIINSGEDKDKISAIKELRTSSKDLFDKMFDSGIFEKKLGKLEIREEKTLKDIDKLSKDEKRKFYKKLAEAENIIRDDKPDRKE